MRRLLRVADGLRDLRDRLRFGGSRAKSRLRRAFGFDYSDTGDNRRRGRLVMLGEEVLVINTGPRLVAANPTLH